MSNDPTVIDEMLHTARTIAVVGMSDKTWRASHNIGSYLAGNGYRVIPVNPALNEVLGMTCYPDLDAAQAAAREQDGAGIDLSGIPECRVFAIEEALLESTRVAGWVAEDEP